MRIFMICGSLAALMFVAMGMQLGLFGGQRHASVEAPVAAPVERKTAPPRAKFPDELAPAAQGRAVEAAAAFEPGDRPHALVFFKSNGDLHPWHEDHGGYHEDWWTTSVEKAELVVVIGNARKTAISHHKYPNGAPPITRYQFDLEAAVVEAKTGQVLANRMFQNLPRELRKIESWETTALGAPVSYHTVFRWAAGIAKSGPPAHPNQPPLITVLKD